MAKKKYRVVAGDVSTKVIDLSPPPAGSVADTPAAERKRARWGEPPTGED